MIVILSNDQSTLQTTTILITVPAGNSLTINWGDESTDTVTCDGTVKTLTHNYSTTGGYEIGLEGDYDNITYFYCTRTFVSGALSNFSALTALETLNIHNSLVAGDISALSSLTSLTSCVMPYGVYGDLSSVAGLTNLQRLDLYNAGIEGDLNDLADLMALTYLDLAYTTVCGDISSISNKIGLETLLIENTEVTGDLSDLSALTSLSTVYLWGTNIIGNISALSALTQLIDVVIAGTGITGDIAVFAGKTLLMQLAIYDCSVYGNISSIAGLTSLLSIDFSNTGVEGDIAGFTSFSNLIYLISYNSSITGNLADIASLTSLVYLWLSDTSLTYTTTSLPAWAGNDIELTSCGFSSAEVDNILIDLASGCGANGRLNLGGTNAARTSASDAALATLIAAGWTVTTAASTAVVTATSVTFFTAETNLIEEVSDRIASLAPDYKSNTPFQRYKKNIDDPSILLRQFFGVRQFAILPGKRIGLTAFGYSYSFPELEYEIIVQYPRGVEWTLAANSDVGRIQSDLLNHGSTVDGVQARFSVNGNYAIQSIDNETDPFQTATIPLTVYYSVTA